MKMRPIFWALLMLLMPLVMAAQSERNDPSQRTWQFIVMGYQGIALDLKTGRGPYVDTLLDLLGTTPSDKPDTLQQVQALLTSHPNIMDFADQVLLLQSTVSASGGVSTSVEPKIPPGPNVYSGADLDNELKHLTRGMRVVVTLKNGERLEGAFSEYSSRRLYLRGTARRSVSLKEILALQILRP